MSIALNLIDERIQKDDLTWFLNTIISKTIFTNHRVISDITKLVPEVLVEFFESKLAEILSQ